MVFFLLASLFPLGMLARREKIQLPFLRKSNAPLQKLNTVALN
jgi:hypothetical protein